MKKVAGFALLLALFNGSSLAADYVIDGSGAGMHSSVQFKAIHVGVSALWGRFNDITGSFSYDADDISASTIEVMIDPASIDSNHAARDEHLASADFLNVASFPEAKFVSTSIMDKGEGMATVTGDFTLHGVTNEISFDIVRTGEGETPFGDYRVGFEGSLAIDLADYGISPISPQIELLLAIEGIRQ
ncbi:YceI family protein [Gammaproteobacteria bacterium]|nr:YceI family protein [Gammaproteobacteria bacterium]